MPRAAVVFFFSTLLVCAAFARDPVPYTTDAVRVLERRADGLLLEADCTDLPWAGMTELVAVVAVPENGGEDPRLLEVSCIVFSASSTRTVAAAPLDDASRERLAALVRLERLDTMRDLALARLVVSPTQPTVFGGDDNAYYTRVRFLLPYDRGGTPAPRASAARGTDFSDLLDAFVLNAFDRDRLCVAAAEYEIDPATRPYLEVPAVKALTDEPGLYAVTVDDVSDAVPPGSAAEAVVVETASGPAACGVLAGEPGAAPYWRHAGSLAAGDRIVWHAERSASPFDRRRAFWIRTARPGETARRFVFDDRPAGTEAASVAALVHLEEDHVFNEEHGEQDQRQAGWWMWGELRHPSLLPPWRTGGAEEAPSLAVDVHAPHAAQVQGILTLRLVDAQGRPPRPLRDVIVRWGESVLAEAEPAAPAEASGETWQAAVALPAGGKERLELRFADSDGIPTPALVYLDWLRVAYRRAVAAGGGPQVFEVESGSLHGGRVAGATRETLIAVRAGGEVHVNARFGEEVGLPALPAAATCTLTLSSVGDLRRPELRRAPQDRAALRSAARGADYLVVSHPDFVPAAGELAAFHAERGLRVDVVTTEQIYDEFGDGTVDPPAIRAFLRYTLDGWAQPGPSYVLLLGDASWDYWGRFSPSVPVYVPSYRLPSENNNLYYPSDNWFACLRGDGVLPDVHIGRLPVQDATSAGIAVRKSLLYMRNEDPGPWHARFLFLTDDGFEEFADSLIQHKVPPYMEFQEIRFEDFPFVDNVYLPPEYVEQQWEERRELVKASPPLTEYLLRTIDDGALVLEYFGHGSPNVLGHERVLFGGGSKFSDVPRMRNGARLPFLIAWTCETGYFDFAEPKWNVSIGEDLLRHPDGGAAMLYVASGRGYSHQHVYLASGLHEGMFHRQLRNVGDIVAGSKLVCAALSRYREPISMFLLLGDPGVTFDILPRRPTACRVEPAQVDGDRGGRIDVRVPPLFIVPETGRMTIVAEDHRGRAFVSETRPNRALDEPTTFSIEVPPKAAQGPGRVVVHTVVEREGRPPQELFASGTFEVVYADSPPPPEARPNLTLDVDRMRIVNEARLYDGMTLLVEADVINDGSAVARDVAVRLEPVERGPQPTPREKSIRRLLPDERETVLLRYDSYGLSATHEFRIRVDPADRLAEAREDDNEVRFPVYYRGKPDLALAAEDLSLSEDGGGLFLFVRLRNVGESPATGIYYHTIGSTAISVGVEYRRRGDRIDTWQAIEPSPAYRTAIAPGEAYEPENGVALPADAVRLRVTLDDPSYVDERNRDNNRLEIGVDEIARVPHRGRGAEDDE